MTSTRASSDLTLNHVGYEVSDLDRARAWCVEVLGATMVGEPSAIPETDIRLGFVAIGGYEFELIERGESAPPAYAGVAHNVLGSYHVCLETSDINAEYARLCELGVSIVSFAGRQLEPVQAAPGLKTFYFRDPDGFMYQALGGEPGERAGEQPAAVFDRGVHHIGFNVRSLEGSLEWYREMLGFECEQGAGRDGMGGVFAPAGLALREALVPVGDVLVEMMEWQDVDEQEPLSGFGPVHLAVSVGDAQVALSAMKQAGSPIFLELASNKVQGSRGYGRSYFIAGDLDGLAIQAVQELPAA